jgi:methylthioribose-1-phosphate isomerase
MLPFIIGGAIVAAVGFALSEKEQKHKEKRKKQLKQQHKQYTHKIQKKNNNNNLKKQKILFKQIKNEQSKLKKERSILYNSLYRLKKGSPAYNNIKSKIHHTTYLIEQKQQNANKVKSFFQLT